MQAIYYSTLLILALGWGHVLKGSTPHQSAKLFELCLFCWISSSLTAEIMSHVSVFSKIKRMHPLKFIWRVFFLIAHPNFTYPTSCPPTASLLIFNVSGSSSRIRLQDSTVCQHHRGTPMSSFYPLSCNEDLSTKMSFSYQILKKGIFNQNQLHRHLQVPSRKTIIFS